MLDADVIVRAWGLRNRPTVDRLATTGVSAGLFGLSARGGVSWRWTGSTGTAGNTFVSHHDDVRGGTVTLGVSTVLLS